MTTFTVVAAAATIIIIGFIWINRESIATSAQLRKVLGDLQDLRDRQINGSEQAEDEPAARTQEHERVEEILHLVGDWMRRAEEDGADTMDLVREFRKAGYRLPLPHTE